VGWSVHFLECRMHATWLDLYGHAFEPGGSDSRHLFRKQSHAQWCDRRVPPLKPAPLLNALQLRPLSPLSNWYTAGGWLPVVYVHARQKRVLWEKRVCNEIDVRVVWWHTRGVSFPTFIIEISCSSAVVSKLGWLRISDFTATLLSGLSFLCPRRHTANAPLWRESHKREQADCRVSFFASSRLFRQSFTAPLCCHSTRLRLFTRSSSCPPFPAPQTQGEYKAVGQDEIPHLPKEKHLHTWHLQHKCPLSGGSTYSPSASPSV